MDEQQGIGIMQRVYALDDLIYQEYQDFERAFQPALDRLGNQGQAVQGQVDELTRQVNELGDQFRQQLTEQLSQRLDNFVEQYIEPTETAIQQVGGACDDLTEQADKFVQEFSQPITAINELTEELGDKLDEFKATVIDTLEEKTDEFIEATTETSEEMLETLNAQIEQLAAYLEQWVNDVTGLGDVKLHQALQEYTQKLTAEITTAITQLLDTLLERFDQYLERAKQALLDALSQGSASRESIEAALEKLEGVRQVIEETVEQVRGLAEQVGIPL